MNEVTKINLVPAQIKTGLVSSAPGSSQGQKTGNDLPPAAQAATTRPQERVEAQAMQERITAAVAQMNEYIQATQRDLQFSYDQGSGETIVKVLDRTTQEVIRQIPDETFLRIAQNLNNEEPLRLLSVEV